MKVTVSELNRKEEGNKKIEIELLDVKEENTRLANETLRMRREIEKL